MNNELLQATCNKEFEFTRIFLERRNPPPPQKKNKINKYIYVDPSGEKGPSGGWCHNVRNDVINVGNFPGTTDIHVVIFYDYQLRSIAFGTHLMIQNYSLFKETDYRFPATLMKHRSYVIIFVIRPCRKREVGHRPQHVNSDV